MKKLETIFVLLGKEMQEMKISKFLKGIRDETGCKADWVADLWRLIEKHGDAELNDALEGDERKVVAAAIKALKAAKKAHEDHVAELEAAEARAEKEAVRERDAMILAAPKGVKIAEHNIAGAIDLFSQSVKTVSGGAFKADETGIDPAKGSTITKECAAHTLATMLSTSDGVAKLNSTSTWCVGDMGNFIKDNFDDGEALIEQIVAVNGRAKHTLVQAMRICSFFPHEVRDSSLTFTHYQESANYLMEGGQLKISKQKFDSFIKKVKEGNLEVPEIELSTGKKIEAIRKPLSVKATRALARELAGLPPPPPKPEKGKGERVASADTPGFLYIDPDGKVLFGVELSLKACAPMTVVDLKSMTVLADDGTDLYKIESLGDEWYKTDKKGGKKEKEKEKEPKKAQSELDLVPG